MTTIHPMIEKCARALAESDSEGGWDYPEPNARREIRKFYRQGVIAVLRTLREPDEGMIDMGIAYFPIADIPYLPEEYDPAVRQVFTAMIDSILPEEKEQP